MKPYQYLCTLLLGSGALGALLLDPAFCAASDADTAAAQALFDQGKTLMGDGHYAEACPKFAESERLDPGIGTLLNLADCTERQGKLATAWSQFREAADMASAANNSEAEQIARGRAEQLARQVSNIVIDVNKAHVVAGFQLTRDGKFVGEPEWRVPIPVDEGRYTIRASAPGHEPWETTVQVKGSGESVVVKVDPLKPLPGATDDATGKPSTGLGKRKLLAIVVGSVGVAALGTGIVLALVAKSKFDSADKTCPGDAVCHNQGAVDQSSSAATLGNVATVGFVVGAVGLAAGTVLWLTAKPRDEQKPSAGVAIGLGNVRLAGRW